MNLKTLRYLSKYIFQRKDNDILGKDFENKYAMKNEDYEPIFIE